MNHADGLDVWICTWQARCGQARGLPHGGGAGCQEVVGGALDWSLACRRGAAGAMAGAAWTPPLGVGGSAPSLAMPDGWRVEAVGQLVVCGTECAREGRTAGGVRCTAWESPTWNKNTGAPKEPPQSSLPTSRYLNRRCMCARAYRTDCFAMLLLWQGNAYGYCD